jgi:hypothetical protein
MRNFFREGMIVTRSMVRAMTVKLGSRIFKDNEGIIAVPTYWSIVGKIDIKEHSTPFDKDTAKQVLNHIHRDELAQLGCASARSPKPRRRAVGPIG